ncbi:hypothetical protein C9374_004880 [Naegleria lovaniensis]|uniref:Meckel syndrome type 1 protein n=1 Tax=Naegleria lovaniensis TaxID=51637 RepID=A0AA88GQZ1_NAELO|nr:uncharacterized protein C9374_004880 [Naegleria lovaniensis]KAG2382913.1 hypothetical protein C9374_004880 [Naegleria lovaniensis]
MDVPLNERPPTGLGLRQRMGMGSTGGSVLVQPSQRQNNTVMGGSANPMAQSNLSANNTLLVGTNNANNTTYNNNQQVGIIGSLLNQFGSGLCGMITAVGGCFNGCAGSVFSGFNGMSTNLSGYIPNLTMLQFRLLNLLSPTYNSNANNPFEKYNDLLIMKSNSSTVQYYSRDSMDNLKIKVTIRRTNMVIGKKTLKERKEQNEGSLESNLEEDDEDTEYKNHVTVFQWQQKVFSPREIVVYNDMKFPNTTLDGFYKREVDALIEMLGKEKLSIDLLPYIQDDLDTEQMMEMFDYKRDKSFSHNEEQGITQQQHAEQKTRPHRKKFGTDGISDLLQHKLFTYTDIDDFYTNQIHTSIPCASNEQYPISKKRDPTPQQSKCQTMYIMASVGGMDKGIWKGKEYPICIIQALPDGSFLMKPGFSLKPQDGEKEEPMSEFLKRYQNEIGDIDFLNRNKENRYIFRTEDGAVYEYTISLYNDYKKDNKIDETRKRILKQLHEKSLQMKRNLVGMEFNDTPKNYNFRLSISGTILSGRDFEADRYFVRYYFDLPSKYSLENPMSQKLVSSTQMGVASEMWNEFENYFETHFAFPFHFDCLCDKISPTPKLFFQVTSKDSWDRFRVEGYGFVSIPSTPGYHKLTVQTWKPAGSIRNNLRSRFVGGSTELRDLSYTAIPNGFDQHFLNKFGFCTETSGSITLSLNIILHGLEE